MNRIFEWGVIIALVGGSAALIWSSLHEPSACAVKLEGGNKVAFAGPNSQGLCDALKVEMAR
jgi:hypothetical protein